MTRTLSCPESSGLSHASRSVACPEVVHFVCAHASAERIVCRRRDRSVYQSSPQLDMAVMICTDGSDLIALLFVCSGSSVIAWVSYVEVQLSAHGYARWGAPLRIFCTSGLVRIRWVASGVTRCVSVSPREALRRFRSVAFCIRRSGFMPSVSVSSFHSEYRSRNTWRGPSTSH